MLYNTLSINLLVYNTLMACIVLRLQNYECKYVPGSIGNERGIAMADHDRREHGVWERDGI